MPFGIANAREAVARYYAERAIEVDAARVMLTTSTSEAYSFIFRLRYISVGVSGNFACQPI